VEALGIDCAEPARLAAFWANVLDYEVRPSDDPNEVTVTPRDGKGTHLLFAKVPEVKAVKNRLHLDLRPENQDAEVERVLALGAKKVDIGQGQQTWVVLADPEGNEFCILRNLTPEERAEREKRDAV
jgi:hypothetical protein